MEADRKLGDYKIQSDDTIYMGVRTTKKALAFRCAGGAIGGKKVLLALHGATPNTMMSRGLALDAPSKMSRLHFRM